MLSVDIYKIIDNEAVPLGGGGIHLVGYAAVTNNVVWGNSSGGIGCVNTSATITNTIVWNNDGPEIDNGGPTVTYCNIQGGWPSTGNLNADPCFVDPANGDFHLTWLSPCRNRGDNSAVTEPEDIEGDPCIADGTVDMGADEYYYRLYRIGNPVPGGTVTFKVVGDPETNPVQIFHGFLRNTPLSTQYGTLYIKKPFPDIWDVGPVPANGIAFTSVVISSSVPSGYRFYFQALHGPLNNPNTKLTNLLKVKVR